MSFLVRSVQNLFDVLGYIELWGIVHSKSEFDIPGAGLDSLFRHKG